MSHPILVTGAGGFIGSAIVRKLRAEGHRIVAIGRTASRASPQIEWIPLDLLSADETQLDRVLAATQPRLCIHAAWYTAHRDYLVHAANRDWVGASTRLVGAFRRAKGQRFVGLGTCLEYDLRHANVPCAESETPLAPGTPYGQAKLELFRALEDVGGDFAWPRIFFVYGPGDRAGRFIPQLVEGVRRGAPVPPRHGGLRRDYIHVDDLADQIVRIATGAVQGAVNVGSGEAPSLAQIYNLALAATGAGGSPANDAVGDEPPLLAADLARFRAEVGDPRARSIERGLAGLLDDAR